MAIAESQIKAAAGHRSMGAAGRQKQVGRLQQAPRTIRVPRTIEVEVTMQGQCITEAPEKQLGIMLLQVEEIPGRLRRTFRTFH